MKESKQNVYIKGCDVSLGLVVRLKFDLRLKGVVAAWITQVTTHPETSTKGIIGVCGFGSEPILIKWIADSESPPLTYKSTKLRFDNVALIPPVVQQDRIGWRIPHIRTS